MDFMYSDEQQMLRDSLARYLANNYDFDARRALVASEEPWSASVWSQFAEMGLLALPFTEDQGGLGGSISDVVAISELFGEYLVIEPYLSSILLAGGALARSESKEAHDWLDMVVEGEAVAALAHEEGKGTVDPAAIKLRADESGGMLHLTGEKRLVLNGAEATQLVVSARIGDTIGLVMVAASDPGLSVTAVDMIDGRRAAHIRFDGAKVAIDNLLVADAEEALEAIVQTAILALSAEAVGAMNALLRQTGEYAATRKQFGVPIGSFQAVAHRLADMKIAYTKARSTLLYTTALAESGQISQRDISILKGQVGKLGRAIGEAAIQTHGGVGMTDELNIGHYHKRLIAIDAMFGNSEYHLRNVGRTPIVAAG